MRTVREVLGRKGHEVWSIGPEESVFRALEWMAEKGIGALIVCEGERPVGIFSERDYARKVILLGRSSRDTPVREIMTRRVVYVRPEQSVEQCMAVMTDKRVRHLPVLEGERLVGVISIGDLVKSIIDEQRFLIEQLEQYISG
ncbi:MAG: CBS domain-containing protein [Gemmatimonadota bacterium]